jgi:glucokinase
VQSGRAHTTNLPWIIDAKKLSTALGITTLHLMNDLEANAFGIRVLPSDAFAVVQKGAFGTVGNQAVISAGTGLGQAALFWDGKEHHPFASEGGHVDFAPQNELQIELLQWLQKKWGHVSYERVVSGPGLAHVREFLIETGRSENDLNDLFLSCYGAEAGNLALKINARGGVFLGGGIVVHLVNAIKEGSFLAAFRAKGRFAKWMEEIPVFAILNDQAALLGAAYYAEHRL